MAEISAYEKLKKKFEQTKTPTSNSSFAFANSVGTTGIKSESGYKSLLEASSLLADTSLANKSTDELVGGFTTQSSDFTGRATNADKKQVDTLLAAIRARQGEINTRKSLTQTRTSLLG